LIALPVVKKLTCTLRRLNDTAATLATTPLKSGDKMAEKYMCTGCYRTEGHDNGADYCDECASYKYFAWVEEDEDTYYE
jgi:hypothetical protein